MNTSLKPVYSVPIIQSNYSPFPFEQDAFGNEAFVSDFVDWLSSAIKSLRGVMGNTFSIMLNNYIDGSLVVAKSNSSAIAELKKVKWNDAKEIMAYRPEGLKMSLIALCEECNVQLHALTPSILTAQDTLLDWLSRTLMDPDNAEKAWRFKKTNAAPMIKDMGKMFTRFGGDREVTSTTLGEVFRSADSVEKTQVSAITLSDTLRGTNLKQVSDNEREIIELVGKLVDRLEDEDEPMNLPKAAVRQLKISIDDITAQLEWFAPLVYISNASLGAWNDTLVSIETALDK